MWSLPTGDKAWKAHWVVTIVTNVNGEMGKAVKNLLSVQRVFTCDMYLNLHKYLHVACVYVYYIAISSYMCNWRHVWSPLLC